MSHTKILCLLQDDVNVYRSSPPLPDIPRPAHLLPSAHLPRASQLDQDPDDVGTALDYESDENFPSADFEEEVSEGDKDRSPSPGIKLGAGHPRAPRTTTRKRKASTPTGDTRYVL